MTPHEEHLPSAAGAAPVGDALLHWYRVREFPIALCGHVSPHATLREAQAGIDRGSARVCPRCRELDMRRLGVSR